MYVSLRKSISQKRRGVILLIVLMMLVLFAIVGITFVLMADARSTEARIYREAQNATPPSGITDANTPATTTNQASLVPDLQLAYFLNRLIYDDQDDTYGISDGMRGLSLARGMYSGQAGNSAAYNGVGRIRGGNITITDNKGNTLYTGDPYGLAHYQYFFGQTSFVDPEHQNPRSNVSNPPAGNDIVQFNVAYTYPDLNNSFLASINSDGTVVMRSFFRDYLFASGIYGAPGGASVLDPNNPNWTNAQGRYLINRPRPVDMGPGFPYPADMGGDVQNLENGPGYFDIGTGKYYTNDSMWMDINYPILTDPNTGIKYKPLFAPLIIDLAGLVNVNVHGNIRNQANQNQLTHASNHGLAATEVNLQQVLTNLTNPYEVSQLFTGASGVAGRYGTWTGAPMAVPIPTGNTPSNLAGGSNTPHFYAQVDSDGGTNGQAGNPIVTAAANPVLLPGATNFVSTLANGPTALGQFYAFPAFPNNPFSSNPGTQPNTYLSGWMQNGLEQKNHPVLFGPFAPISPNSVFPISEMESILRYGQANTPTSRILQLLPNTLVNDPADANSALNTAMRRRQLTLLSPEVDKAGLTPWLSSSNPANNGDYALANGSNFPQGGPANFPNPATNGAMEFNATRGGRDASLGRVDVNRAMTNYPVPDPTTGAFKAADIPQYQAAVQARQLLAKDIFNRLRSVTTGYTTSDPFPKVGTPEYEAHRWLAQLAVNIVDFVNSDEYSTPFHWDTNNNLPNPGNTTDTTNDQGWVFGTKLPRVLVNEVYAQGTNVPGQVKGQAPTQFNLNLWVELHNPMQTEPPQTDSTGKNIENRNNDKWDTNSPPNSWVRLQATDPQKNQTYAIYKVEITQNNTNLTATTNVRGSPDAKPLSEVTGYDKTTGVPSGNCDSTLIQPANGSYGGLTNTNNGNNVGFYVLGPTDPANPNKALAFPQGSPNAGDTRALPQSTFASPGMNVNNIGSVPANVSVLLRRLACPAMPHNSDPTSASYNPYITVDYVQNVTVNDATTFDGAGQPQTPNYSALFSMGKMEPYAAATLQKQNQLSNPYTDRPQHTFFRQNATVDAPPVTSPDAMLTFPFHWLSQLNRSAISAMELTQVSAFKPHLLTQMFVTAAGPNQHTANWFDPKLRIYRAFEFLEAADRVAGSVKGGRYPAKMNINSVKDLQGFRALCDAQTPNYFSGSTSTLSGAASAGTTTITVGAFTGSGPDASKQTTWTVLPQDPIMLNALGSANFELVVVQSATFANGSWTITTVNPVLNNHAANEPVTLELVRRFFNRMIAARDNPQGMAAGPGTPFQSYAQGNIPAGDTQYPAGNGIQNTILQASASGGRMFEITDAPHPYYRYELMNKIFDRITTRSNAFAVWVTVGYFPVTNAGQLAPGQTQNGYGLPTIQLGPEITDPVTGLVTRHKMFAVLDRSALTFLTGQVNLPGSAPIFLYGENTNQNNLVPTSLAVDGLSGQSEGVSFTIGKGTTLVLDEGRENEEQVTVTGTGTSGGKPTIQIQGATKQHPLVIPLSFADRRMGNPGPQPGNYDPRAVDPRTGLQSGVVKYYRLVQ